MKTQYRHNHADSEERVLTHVRTIWPGGRQYADDATTQLLCITAACIYQLMSDDIHVHKQSTSRWPRVKTPGNSIYLILTVQLQVPMEANETAKGVEWFGLYRYYFGQTISGLPPDQPPVS